MNAQQAPKGLRHFLLLRNLGQLHPPKTSHLPPPPLPLAMLLFDCQHLLLLLPMLWGGGEGELHVKNVMLRRFFPNCGLPSSVSQLLLSLIAAVARPWLCFRRESTPQAAQSQDLNLHNKFRARLT